MVRLKHKGDSMEENSTVPRNNPTPVDVSTKPKKKIKLLYPLFLVLSLLAVGGVYYWRDSQAKTQQKADQSTISKLEAKVSDLEKQLADAKKVSTKTEVTGECKQPSATAKENIIASITSKNSAALEGYMASSVKVILAASEASFDRTPEKAVSDIEYVINATAPWNFALSTATLDSYKAGFYKDYFKDNSIVGVASDKKVIVFNFDCAGKINGVFMAASTDLLVE